MTMTPLINTQITDMDQARMEFANKLNEHCAKLREELRISELILESVIRSLSSQTQDMAELNTAVHEQRLGSASHRPVMITREGGEDLLKKLADTFQATQQTNSNGNHN
jgi:hypothetical protein